MVFVIAEMSGGVPAAMACTVCGEHTHLAARCSALRPPLGEGFYRGGGGGGGHGHDEDDDEHQNYGPACRDDNAMCGKPLHSAARKYNADGGRTPGNTEGGRRMGRASPYTHMASQYGHRLYAATEVAVTLSGREYTAA